MKGFSCRGQKKMHDGTQWQVHKSIRIHTHRRTHTPHTRSFTCPPSTGSVQDSPFFSFLCLRIRRNVSVCLYLQSSGGCVCADVHNHTHSLTHTQSLCTDTQTPAPTHTQTHTHTTQTHTHAAFCCCDGSELSKHPRFHSLSLTKAARLSLSTQVHRDCCLPFLSFLSSYSPLSPFVSFNLCLFIFAQPPFPLFFLVLSPFLFISSFSLALFPYLSLLLIYPSIFPIFPSFFLSFIFLSVFFPFLHLFLYFVCLLSFTPYFFPLSFPSFFPFPFLSSLSSLLSFRLPFFFYYSFLSSFLLPRLPLSFIPLQSCLSFQVWV